MWLRIRVVGKFSWEDRAVGKFLVRKICGLEDSIVVGKIHCSWKEKKVLSDLD